MRAFLQTCWLHRFTYFSVAFHFEVLPSSARAMHTQRRPQIQILNALAKDYKARPCARDARMQEVAEMAGKIRKKEALTDEDKQKLDTALGLFRGSFKRGRQDEEEANQGDQPAPAAAAAAAAEEKPKKRALRGRSFLLTYNHDFFNKAFPDGTPAVQTTGELWRLWKKWKNEKIQELGVSRSTSTLERSLHSPLEGRVHFHWKADLHEVVDNRTTAIFWFHGIEPDVRTTSDLLPGGSAAPTRAARGVSFQEASNRGHFYCWAAKKGTLKRGTNYAPFKNFRVNGRWLEDMWCDNKLDDEAYMELSIQVRRGHANRKRDYETVRADARAARIKEQIADVDSALWHITAPFKKFTAVREWEDSHLDLDFRWKLLVLCADSSSGKSMFAESLFRKPFVIVVEDAEHLDLKGLDNEVHDGVVLDNVNSWNQLRKWRAILQARNVESKGGKSSTGMYSYTQYLFAMPVVVTVDVDTPDAHLVEEGHARASNWLLTNCIFVRLERGDSFYIKSQRPNVVIPNAFSRFAETVRLRRAAESGEEPSEQPQYNNDQGTGGPPEDWFREEEETLALMTHMEAAEEAAHEEAVAAEADADPFGWGHGFD